LALKLKKILSYLWPITRRYSSKINGLLEVTYIDGKKVLDSKNANYSYGQLQKVLEFGVEKIDLNGIKNILLLGMGGGSIVRSLREKFKYTGLIIAVEIDPKVIEIAKEEFGIVEYPNQSIVQEDAFIYVKNSNEAFQLIIIDLFIDSEVPTIFFEQEFCRNVADCIDLNGFLIFNLGMGLKENSGIIRKIMSYFGEEFELNIHFQVHGLNELLIAKKIS